MGIKELPLRSSACTQAILTSDQISSLLVRTRKKPKDRENRMPSRYDSKLLDASCEVISNISGVTGRAELVRELRASCEDNSITKQFYHHNATMSNLEGFQDPSKARKDSSWYVQNRCARRLLRKYLHIKKLKPLMVTEDCDPMDFFANPDASAGAIGEGSKAENAELCRSTALKIKAMINAGDDFSSIQIPLMPFHRAQLGDYCEDGHLTGTVTLKDRLVLGVDGGTVMVEGQYFIPLYEHLKSNFWSYSGGDDPQTLRRKIYSCWGMNWLSVDYSKFDQSIQDWLIRQIFGIIKEFFDDRYHREIDWICYNFTHGNILMGWDEAIAPIYRGIISGSFGTQAIGTLCNLYMFLSYLCDLGYREMVIPKAKRTSDEDKVRFIIRYVESIARRDGHLTLQGMGDDLLAFTYKPIDVSDLSKYVERIFGVKIHDDEKGAKSGFRTAPYYLKRYWRGLSGEYRDLLDLFVNLVHPEHVRHYEEKGFSPWHILYGIFLTYRASFPGVSEDWLIEQMNDAGGIDALVRLEPKELPGALRVFGHNVGNVLLESAKRHLAA